MSCVHCGFTYFMTPCNVCKTNFYCHYCTSVIKSCYSCSQKQCNNCKITTELELVKCSNDNCNAKFCSKCVGEHINNLGNTKCLDCVLFANALEGENQYKEEDL